jgi:hypothetical protein
MPRSTDLVIDIGVVNNFSEDIQRFVRKNFPRRVSEINRALNPVAEPKLLREPHRQSPGGNPVPSRAHTVHQLAEIMRLDLRLHLFHHIRTAEIDTIQFFRSNRSFR